MFGENRKNKRRAESDRRQAESPAADNRRATARRGDTERRQWKCGLLYKTSEPAHVVEDWLDDNAAGEWNLILDDMDDALSGKTLKIMFSDIEDKDKFMVKFAKSK